jgi:hypothetical protein
VFVYRGDGCWEVLHRCLGSMRISLAIQSSGRVEQVLCEDMRAIGFLLDDINKADWCRVAYAPVKQHCIDALDI